MEGPLWWVLADNSHQGKSSNLTGSFFFYLLILPVTKRWRSDGHLLVQKGTKNRAKPPNEVTVPQGISAIVRGPGLRAIPNCTFVRKNNEPCMKMSNRTG